MFDAGDTWEDDEYVIDKTQNNIINKNVFSKNWEGQGEECWSG